MAKERKPIKKFKLDPKYPHHRSDGMTKRTNGGSRLQPRKEDKNDR